MTREVWFGLALWMLVLWPLWSPTLRRARKQQRAKGARSSTGHRTARQTGPKWEQDKPFPECFEEDDL